MRFSMRVQNFLNRHLHDLFMLLRFGRLDLNSRGYWDRRYLSGNYREDPGTSPVFTAMARHIAGADTVLDVGVGSGLFLRELRARGVREVYGLDVSQVAIDRLMQDGITGWCCRLPDAPETDRRFDVICAKALLEHLRCPSESLATLTGLSKPGGRLLVSVPNDTLGPDEEPEHFRKYSRASLTIELSRHVTIVDIQVIAGCLLAVCHK